MTVSSTRPLSGSLSHLAETVPHPPAHPRRRRASFRLAHLPQAAQVALDGRRLLVRKLGVEKVDEEEVCGLVAVVEGGVEE